MACIGSSILLIMFMVVFAYPGPVRAERASPEDVNLAMKPLGLVLQHKRADLLDMLKKGSINSIDASWFAGLLRDSLNEDVRVFSAPTMSRLSDIAIAVGRVGEEPQCTDMMDNPLGYTLLVSLLGCSEGRLYVSICNRIIDKGRRERIREFSPAIKRVAWDAESPAARRLLAICELTPSERKELLARMPRHHFTQRAILGDSVAMDSLVARCDSARMPDERKAAAQALAYVRTEKALRCLVKMLQNDGYDTASIEVDPPILTDRRLNILSVFSHIYPNEPLFTCDLVELRYINCSDPKDKRLAREYFMRLYDWAKQEHGLELKNLRNTPCPVRNFRWQPVYHR